MPSWVLDCKNCGQTFRFAEARVPELFSDIVEKPEFPEAGQDVKCPKCDESRPYKRFMLKYSAEPRGYSAQAQTNASTRTLSSTKLCKTAQIQHARLSHACSMKLKDLTAKQLSSISCPTCGVGAGERCIMYSGAERLSPHVERKMAAAEAVETGKLG